MFRDFENRLSPLAGFAGSDTLPMVPANDTPCGAARLTARWLRRPEGGLERVWVRMVDEPRGSCF